MIIEKDFACCILHWCKQAEKQKWENEKNREIE